MWGEGKEPNRTERGSPELGCTWSCRLFLWTQAPGHAALGKGRCKGKDALLKGEGQPPPSASPGEIWKAAREQLVLTAGRELLSNNSSSLGSRDGGKPGLSSSTLLLQFGMGL